MGHPVLGADTPLDQITPAPLTYNRVVATVGSLFTYSLRQGWAATSPAAGLQRRRLRTDHADHARTRAIGEPRAAGLPDRATSVTGQNTVVAAL